MASTHPVAQPATAPLEALARLPVTLQPSPSLLKYYALTALLAGPFFPFLMIPLYFRYHTMRYQVEDEGISMRWGILFRREISLTYARIQDIHLNSNLVERWLGLARIQVQTASGSATAEMTIEGIPQFEAIRDFLYARMRGARDRVAVTDPAGPGGEAIGGAELAGVLREIAAEVRLLRTALPAARADDA